MFRPFATFVFVTLAVAPLFGCGGDDTVNPSNPDASASTAARDGGASDASKDGSSGDAAKEASVDASSASEAGEQDAGGDAPTTTTEASADAPAE